MLFIVSTAVKVGKGGISSALVGFIESKCIKQYGFRLISSHYESEKKAAYKKAKSALCDEVTAQDDVWLHCGPWLSMFRKWRLAKIAKQRGAHVFFHFHSPKVERYLDSKIGRWLITQMLLTADGLIVLTPWWKRKVETALPRLKCPVAVIGNPLGQLFQSAPTCEVSSEGQSATPTILTMARLVPEKGVADVIRALTHLPNYNLKIAGTGPELPHLQEMVEQLSLTNRVEFLGWVGYDDKRAIMEAADVFCLPSRYDSFGMAFIEAMAMGLPVVAIRQGAVPDVVLDGKTGILVDNSNAQTLQKAITVAVANKEDFGNAGRTWVQAEYDNELLAQRLLTFISDRRLNHES